MDPVTRVWRVLQAVHVDSGGFSKSAKPEATWKTKDGTGSSLRKQRSSLTSDISSSITNPKLSSKGDTRNGKAEQHFSFSRSCNE